MNLPRPLLPLAIACLLPLPVLADEVEAAIQSALVQYKEGKLAETSASLQAALKAVNEKQGLGVSAVLPDQIGGWKGGEITAGSLAALGGGQSVERSYRKGERKATISIVSDAKTLNQISAFIANPAIGGLLGIKARQVGDITAMVQPKEGVLQFAVNDRHIIAVQGKKLKEDELVELAKGVKTDALKAMK